MNTLKEIIEIENFLTDVELEQVNSTVEKWQMVPYYSNGGRFTKGSLIANQAIQPWDQSDQAVSIIKPKLDNLLGEYRVSELVLQELSLPWDVHTDYVRSSNVGRPYYSVIIALSNCDSRTILFDQTAEHNDFYKFKQTNKKTTNPVDQNFWQNNLSHCWDEDREYLSLRYVSRPWKPGNLFSFQRNVLHSSDNFHTRTSYPKRFIQILTDKI
jgi:hypothetical protein